MHYVRKEIRHTLLKDLYVDIDIVNCHPTLLYQMCKKNNIECEYLNQYINNRDNILNETMQFYDVSKDCAKRLFIQLIYFGSFKSWCLENNINNNVQLEFIDNFKNEINLIGKIIISYNNKLVKAVQKYKLSQMIIIMKMVVLYHFFYKNTKIKF